MKRTIILLLSLSATDADFPELLLSKKTWCLEKPLNVRTRVIIRTGGVGIPELQVLYAFILSFLLKKLSHNGSTKRVRLQDFIAVMRTSYQLFFPNTPHS